MATTNQRVRILFQLDADDWHGHATEGIWCEPVPGSDSGDLVRLLNSPFFAMGVSHLDVVRASESRDVDRRQFVEVVERSGHSTYMVLTPRESNRFFAHWAKLESMGCTYETTHIDTSMGWMDLYSIDVPATVDLRAAFEILDQARRAGDVMLQAGYVAKSSPT